MNTLHIILLATTAGLIVAVAAHQNLRGRGEHLPALGHAIGAALVAGNAACLLPATPLWCHLAMIGLTVTGLLCLPAVIRSADRRRPDTGASARPLSEHVSEQIYAGIMPSRPERARPELRIVRNGAESGSGPMRSARPALPQEHAATAGITSIDARGTRPAHGRFAPRSHDATDPTVRFLRFGDDHGIDRGPRSLGRSARFSDPRI